MKKTTSDGTPIKSRIQKMYKVGYGPNQWGLLSEDSLDKYSNIIGMEYYGEREIFYIEQEEEPVPPIEIFDMIEPE